MRRHLMRRGVRPAGQAAIVPTPPRQSEADRLAKLTREIAEETGASCALVLGLIERRAPGITPSDAAAYILGEWRKDGDARARLLDHAAKTPEALRAERELAQEIKRILKPFAGRVFSIERTKEIRSELFKFVRARLPKLSTRQLAIAVRAAVDFREDRLVIRLDGLAAILAPHAALSS